MNSFKLLISNLFTLAQFLTLSLRLIFISLVCLLSFILKAQTPYFYTLGEENGLPSSEVYQVKQDKFGFMWIGCDAGLFRYDGIHFKQYNSSKEKGRSISELRFDNKGNLWCQNFAGQIFKVGKDSLVLFKDFSAELRGYPAYTIDNNFNLWISGEKFIQKFDSSGRSMFKHFPVNSKGDTIIVIDIECAANGNIIVSSIHNGPGQFTNPLKPQISWFNIEELKNKRTYIDKSYDNIYLLCSGDKNNPSAIYQLSKNNIHFVSAIEKKLSVYKVSRNISGDLWVATSGGVFKLESGKSKADSLSLLFKGDKISGIFEDREGNSWFSSLQNGIHVIPNSRLFLLNKNNINLEDNYISSLGKSNQNRVLIGTYSGYAYIFENGLLKKIPQTQSNYRAVKSMSPFKDGLLISRGMFSFATDKKEIVIPELNNVRDFKILNDTLFYTSSHYTGYFTNISSVISNPKASYKNVKLMERSGRSVCIDSANRVVYYALNEGVFEFKSNILKPIKNNNQSIYGSKLIFSNNKLWIATISNGITSYSSGKLNPETKLNRLIVGKQIKTMSIEGDVLWLATEKCFNKINLKQLQGEYFDLSDGLVSKEINDVLIFDKMVFLATNKGIITFPAFGPSVSQTNPNIAITGLEINDLPLPNPVQNLTLSYNNHKIKIMFATACLRARGNFSYKYRMLGLDTIWTSIPAVNNSAIFSSLPAGTFTFEVKAVNEDGVESVRSEQIILTVKKPFWQKVWFYILVSFSGALITVVVSLFIIKNIKKKARTKSELISSQLTAIRAQMNPHFMYNTLNSIQDLILKSDIKNTNYYLSKFSTLMRKILEFSENETVLLDEEIEMLQTYLELEKLRFGSDFNFQISVNSSLNLQQTHIPSLIIQPFVENAIKHGLLHKKGEKFIELDFIKTEEGLLISITDNGVGRSRSMEINKRNQINHKSFATSAVQKRLELLNQNNRTKISCSTTDLFNDGNPSGTLVEIFIHELI